MAVMAKWRNKTFEVSRKKVNPLKNFSTSTTIKGDDSKSKKKKDEGPKFDPAGYLYWAKLKKEVAVNIIDPAAIDSLDQPEEVKLVLHGSRTLLDQGHMLLVVIQPSQPIDEKFD